jgi:hypothetical protein
LVLKIVVKNRFSLFVVALKETRFLWRAPGLKNRGEETGFLSLWERQKKPGFFIERRVFKIGVKKPGFSPCGNSISKTTDKQKLSTCFDSALLPRQCCAPERRSAGAGLFNGSGGAGEVP